MTESLEQYIKRMMNKPMPAHENGIAYDLQIAMQEMSRFFSQRDQDPRIKALYEAAFTKYNAIAREINVLKGVWTTEYNQAHGVNDDGTPYNPSDIEEQARVARRVDMCVAAATGMGAVFSLIMIKRTMEMGMKSLTTVAGALLKEGLPGELT